MHYWNGFGSRLVNGYHSCYQSSAGNSKLDVDPTVDWFGEQLFRIVLLLHHSGIIIFLIHNVFSAVPGSFILISEFVCFSVIDAIIFTIVLTAISALSPMYWSRMHVQSILTNVVQLDNELFKYYQYFIIVSYYSAVAILKVVIVITHHFSTCFHLQFDYNAQFSSKCNAWCKYISIGLTTDTITLLYFWLSLYFTSKSIHQHLWLVSHHIGIFLIIILLPLCLHFCCHWCYLLLRWSSWYKFKCHQNSSSFCNVLLLVLCYASSLLTFHCKISFFYQWIY